MDKNHVWRQAVSDAMKEKQSSHVPVQPDERMARLAPLVVAHAQEISRELGWRPDDD